jgi:hypothetical protein
VRFDLVVDIESVAAEIWLVAGLVRARGMFFYALVAHFGFHFSLLLPFDGIT